MSLTSLLASDKAFKEFFKIIKAPKDKFYTLSGKKMLSKEYEEIVPYNLDIPWNSTLVGTAFDYLARFEIARKINKNKDVAYTMLDNSNSIPNKGKLYVILDNYNNESLVSKINREFKRSIKVFEKYVNSEIDDFNILLDKALFFARLEHIYRAGKIISDKDESLMNHFFKFDSNVINELKNLFIAFQENFVKKVVCEDSIVIFNPDFSIGSKLVGGADADLYIDGVLFDFKTSRKREYVGKEVAQISGYYLLHKLTQRYVLNKGWYRNDSVSKILLQDIKKIAFYRARFGEIEYLDTSFFKTFDEKRLLKEFEELLKSINPNFDEIKKNYIK